MSYPQPHAATLSPSKSQTGLSGARPLSQQSGGALMSRRHTVALPHRPLAVAQAWGAVGGGACPRDWSSHLTFYGG